MTSTFLSLDITWSSFKSVVTFVLILYCPFLTTLYSRGLLLITSDIWIGDKSRTKMDETRPENRHEMTGSALDEDPVSGMEPSPIARESEKCGAGMDTRTDLEESQTPDFPLLGPILVIGGCGYEDSPSAPMLQSPDKASALPLQNLT